MHLHFAFGQKNTPRILALLDGKALRALRPKDLFNGFELKPYPFYTLENATRR